MSESRIRGKQDVIDVYGYWPDFHDAQISMVEYRYHRSWLRLTMEYLDIDNRITSEIVFEMNGVRPMRIQLTDDWVYDMSVEQFGDLVVVEWTESCMGYGSVIQAESLDCSIRILKRSSPSE